MVLMKKIKKLSLSTIGLIIAGIGIILIVFSLLIDYGVFKNVGDGSVINVEDDNTKFIDYMEKVTRDGKLNKVIKKAIPNIKNGTNLKMIAIDIDVDDEKELVIFYKNSLVVINVNLLDFKINYKETFENVKDENSLRYLYSFNDSEFVWSYETTEGDYVIMHYDNKTVSKEEFDNNYFVIKSEDATDSINLFEECLVFKYGETKLDLNALEDSMYDDSTIIEKANLTYEEIEGLMNNEEESSE